MYKMYIKILDSLPTKLSFTIEEGEQVLRASVFGITEAFNAFSLVYHISMISTPGRNMREVVIQPFFIGTFAVIIIKHKIIRILDSTAKIHKNNFVYLRSAI